MIKTPHYSDDLKPLQCISVVMGIAARSSENPIRYKNEVIKALLMLE